MAKRCIQCGLTKDESEFHRCATRKDGLHPYCKECRHDRYKLRYAKYLEETYGVSYKVLYDLQDGMCAICGKMDDPQGRDFAMDHDHKTGKLRGLLCSHCNIALGYFEDDIDRLQSAIDYLTSKGVYYE